VLLAVLLHPVHATDWRVLLLLGVLGLLAWPRVFNRLAQLVANRVGTQGPAPLPQVRLPILAGGLILEGCGWGLQGASLWAVLQAVLP
jgi:hypothetical protein